MAGYKAIQSESLKDLVIKSDTVHPNIDKRMHKYKLNDKATKAKIVKGAKRCPFEVVDKSLSSNLDFRLGAWNFIVLPSIRYWHQVKKKLLARLTLLCSQLQVLSLARKTVVGTSIQKLCSMPTQIGWFATYTIPHSGSW